MRIYLDHNATTPLRDEALEAMLPWLREGFGNPSSTHAEGAAARAAIERARHQVASLLCVPDAHVVFTAGATEANNTLLRGWMAAHHDARLVTTACEHPSVEEAAEAISAGGQSVVRVGVDPEGRVDPDALVAELHGSEDLVSVIWANNETGVLQPIEEIAARVHARGARIHSDATQAVGKYPVDAGQVDFLSCSAHKLGGPKAVGCYVAAPALAPPALLLGGGQEKGRRGGTENVAGIVGFGVACALAEAELDSRIARYRELRDRLWEGLAAKVPAVRRNGSPEHVLSNTLSVEVEGAAGEVLLQALDLEGVAISVGAACHSGSISPSRVLIAMGRTPEQARACLRLSVGHGVDEAQIDRAIELLAELAPRARAAEGI